jgi:two-component system response regulator NreC
MTITILLVDDHVVVRQGLRALLETQSDFSVVGEGSNGVEAIQLTNRLRPNVVLLDLMMPGLGGLEVTRQIHSITRVLILSMHDNEAYVLEALRSGALGYILKDSTSIELVQAVRTVAEGRRFLSPPLSERAILSYMEKTRSSPQDAYDTLTTRERQVFVLVAQGFNNHEIAGQLSISPRTVEIHRANVMHKLNLKSQTDLIRYALRKGILPLDD